MTVQREQLEADVLIVGAGPAGLSCALHLANLIKKHNETGGASKAGPQLSAENIYVLEKGREIGAHQLSGAIMNPKALAELVPDFEKSAPLDTPVMDSAALLFTKNSSLRFPITPPPFQNKGNYVVSLSKITKWLGGLVEAAGVNVFKEFGGAELIYEGDGIAGVITEDKGIDKNGKPKDNYGGGWIYGLSNNRISIGLVLALEYADPQFDPHAAFQTWKTHPFLKKLLDGGKLVRYGAKSLPYGGWYAMPRNYLD